MLSIHQFHILQTKKGVPKFILIKDINIYYQISVIRSPIMP